MLTDILYKRCSPAKIFKQENAEVLLMLNASILLMTVKHPSFFFVFSTTNYIKRICSDHVKDLSGVIPRWHGIQVISFELY